MFVCSCRSFGYAVVSILLPPLAVFVAKGCGSDFLINILLTILGFIPGMIHALWITVFGHSSETHRVRV